MTNDHAAAPAPAWPPFNPALWAAAWREARLGLAYFAALHAALDGALDPGPPPGTEVMEDELKFVAQRRRDLDSDLARQGRITAQDSSAANLLAPWGLNLSDRKALSDLMPKLALLVSDWAISGSRMPLMYFKNKYSLARPYERDPSIQPFVGNPGHPSYPSGHTCQHYYAALILDHIVSPIERELAAGNQPALDQVEKRRTVMFDIANDAAENREYAGVHYPADTAAGRRLSAS